MMLQNMINQPVKRTVTDVSRSRRNSTSGPADVNSQDDQASMQTEQQQLLIKTYQRRISLLNTENNELRSQLNTYITYSNQNMEDDGKHAIKEEQSKNSNKNSIFASALVSVGEDSGNLSDKAQYFLRSTYLD